MNSTSMGETIKQVISVKIIAVRVGNRAGSVRMLRLLPYRGEEKVKAKTERPKSNERKSKKRKKRAYLRRMVFS